MVLRRGEGTFLQKGSLPPPQTPPLSLPRLSTLSNPFSKEGATLSFLIVMKSERKEGCALFPGEASIKGMLVERLIWGEWRGRRDGGGAVRLSLIFSCKAVGWEETALRRRFHDESGLTPSKRV